MHRYSSVGSGYIALLVLLLMTCWPVESARLGEDEATTGPAPTTPAAAQSEPQAPTTPAASTTSDQNILLNFKDVELRQIIDLMSDLTNQNYLVDEKVRGKVTIISPRPVSREEAYNIFLSILEVQGFTVVPQGAIHKIIPSREVKESPLPTAVDGADGASANRDDFITQLIPLKYADANEIRGLLSALVSKESSLLAYGPTNTLILTEVQSNISRLMKIIRALDVQAPAAILKVIALKYAAADQMVSSLQGALEGLAEAESDGGEAAATTAQQRRQRRASPQAAASLQRTPTAPKIIADSRTNSLVVIATPSVIMAAEDLIAKLDIPTPEGRGQIHVYYLEHADAEELAQVLTAQASEIERSQAAATPTTGATPQPTRAQPQQAAQRGQTSQPFTGTTPLGITITADKPTNSLVITAPPEAYAVLKEIIEKLDIRRSQVLVEALFAEVTLGTADQFGVEWRVIDDPDGGTQVFASSTGTPGEGGTGVLGVLSQGLSTTATTAGAAALASPTGLIIGAIRNTFRIGDREIVNIPAVLRAFEGSNDVNILATPNLLTTDNQEASIFIGEERPFLTGTQSDATNINVTNRSFDFRDVGIELKMTPQISHGRTVRLELEIKLSAFAGEAEVGAVVTTNREATTTVVSDDGQTIVIGGLIRDDSQASQTGVPCVGNAPLIGWAFHQETKSNRKNNLLIFITPHILNTPGDINRITTHKRQQSDRAQDIEKQLQRNQPQENLEHLLD
jgi:general secretion pathway protein D